jgi:hypothetical protein
VVQGIKRKADAFAVDVQPILADIEASGITQSRGHRQRTERAGDQERTGRNWLLDGRDGEPVAEASLFGFRGGVEARTYASALRLPDIE